MLCSIVAVEDAFIIKKGFRIPEYELIQIKPSADHKNSWVGYLRFTGAPATGMLTNQFDGEPREENMLCSIVAF